MSTLPEQLSAAGKSQVEAQIDFFQNLAARAVENAGKIVALNLDASRASMEKSSSAMFQLLAAQDPRDLMAFGAQGQQQLASMLAYGRALFGIVASSAAPAVAKPSQQPVPQAAPAPMAAPEAAPEPAPQAPALAKASPIAGAAEKVVAKDAPAKPAAAPFPAADRPVVVRGLKAVEAPPPHAAASGSPKAEPKRAAKAGKKK